jgi:hypothetical protein
MKPNPTKNTEEQLTLNLDKRRGIVSQTLSIKALENIKEFLKKPKSAGFNYYDEQK